MTNPPEFSLRRNMNFSRFSGRSTLRHSDRHIVAILCSFGQFCNHLFQLIHFMYTSSSCSISSTSTNWSTCSNWNTSSTLSNIIQMTSISCHSLYLYVTWRFFAHYLILVVIVPDSSAPKVCQHLFLYLTLLSTIFVNIYTWIGFFHPQLLSADLLVLDFSVFRQ